MMFAVILVLFSISQAAKLPDFIVPCKGGPTLNDCAVEIGNKVIKKLNEDGPKHKLPNINPLLVTEIAVSDHAPKGMSFDMTLKNLEVFGLKDANFVKSEMDTEAKSFVWHFEAPKVSFDSQYKISGKILMLPISGEGPLKAHIDNPKFTYSVNYDTFDKDGETYMKIVKTGMNYTLDGLHIELQNLFNGDKTLGDNMNMVMNENWVELNNQLGPPIAQALSLVGKQILETIVKDVPFNHIIES